MTTNARIHWLACFAAFAALGVILGGCASEPQEPPPDEPSAGPIDAPVAPLPDAPAPLDQPQPETPATEQPDAPVPDDPFGLGAMTPGEQPDTPDSDDPFGGVIPPGHGEVDETWRPEEEEEEPDLGPPLVDDLESLHRLDPKKPLWVDKKNGEVVMVGSVCQTEAPLEMFACLKRTKEHESIVTVDVVAHAVHAGLLVVGAKPGTPVRWDPEYAPATGEKIDVIVRWKDADGKRREARAQEWIRDVKTEKAMEYDWVFAGSFFFEDQETGQKWYQAEGGDFICVSNFASAMLDLPVESSQANAALLFEAFTERIPPLGTPATLILRPRAKADGEKSPPDVAPSPGESETAPKPPTESETTPQPPTEADPSPDPPAMDAPQPPALMDPAS